MEAMTEDHLQSWCDSCQLKGGESEGICVCMSCKLYLCQACTTEHGLHCGESPLESTPEITIDSQGVNIRPIVKQHSTSKSQKILGHTISDSKVFMMRCNIHTNHHIENFCQEHDFVCCYKCITSSHTQCSILPIDEVTARLHEKGGVLQKYKDLRQMQYKVSDAIQSINDKVTLTVLQESKSGKVQSSDGGHSCDDLSKHLQIQKEKIMRISLLCRELEDVINVTMQSFKFLIDKVGDVTSFVTFMKNKQRLCMLHDEISVLLAELSIDNEQDKDRGTDKSLFAQVESNIQRSVDLVDEFRHTFQGRGSYKAQMTEPNKQVSEENTDLTHPVNTSKQVIVQNSTSCIKHILEPDIISDKEPPAKHMDYVIEEPWNGSESSSLALDPTKVTRNSTKSGYGKRHRIIRHVDSDMFFPDTPYEDKTFKNKHVQIAIESKDTGRQTLSEHELVKSKLFDEKVEVQKYDEPNSELTESHSRPDTREQAAISMSPYSEDSRLLIESLDDEFESDLPITCNVTPDGSLLSSGRLSVKRPLSQDIILSTNRISTRQSNPPGHSSQPIQVQHRLRLDFMGALNVRVQGDIYPCYINDVTAMPDGKVVVSDFNNSCLKLFGSPNKKTQCLHTRYPPYSVVCVSNSLVIFCYGHAKNQLCLVSVTSGMEIRQEFTTDHACVSLATSNSFIYALCRNDYRTEVHILNTEGVVNMKIDLGVQVAMPQYIAVDPISDRIYVSDHRGLYGIERSGRKMTHIADSAISRYAGLATDSCGNIFVCTEFPDGVYAKPRDKNYLKPLLLGHKVQNVHAVCFNEMNNSLIVSYADSDFIRQYKIKSN